MAKRFKRILAMGLAVAALLLTACASFRAPAVQPAVLNVCLVDEAGTLHPQKDQTTGGMALTGLLYEGLMRPNPDGGWTYGVADSYMVSEDGCTYVYRLRADAVWSDGTSVVAQDFVYAWDQLLRDLDAGDHAADFAQWIAGGWERLQGQEDAEIGVRAVNDKTLEVELVASCPYMDALMARVMLAPLRKGQENLTNGAYRMAEQQGKEGVLRLVRSEDYWNRAHVLPDEIRVHYYAAPQDAARAMRAGEVDFSLILPVEEKEALEQEGFYAEASQAGTWYLDLCSSQPPFDDERVRKAFALAIDPQQALDGLKTGGMASADALVPPGVGDFSGSFYEPGRFEEESRQQQARSALAAAGYPGGEGFPQVELLATPEDLESGLIDALCAQWKDVLGVQVKPVSCCLSQILQRRLEGDYQMARATFFNEYGDAQAMMEGASLFFRYGEENPTFAAVLAKAAQERDEARRSELLHSAEEMLMESGAYAPVYFYRLPYLIRPEVEGLCITPAGEVLLTGAHKEEA